MPIPVYSTCFLALQGLDGSYEVAPDFANIRVLRCLDVYWGGGLSGAPTVFMSGHAGQIIAHFPPSLSSGSDPVDAASWQWQGRQVVPVGGVIFLVSTGPVDVSLSGYTLTP